MGDCDICEGDDGISFSCNECGGKFCSTHRLPEAHQCHALREKEAGGWFKDELSVRDTHIRNESDTEPSLNSDADTLHSGATNQCLECGRTTTRECEECGGTYCNAHRSPRAHNCAFLNATGGTTDTPPNPSNPSNDEPASTGGLRSIVLLPVTLLSKASDWFGRHWKLAFLLIAVLGGLGLAATGNLQPLLTDASGTVDDAADAGNTGVDDANDPINNDLDTTRVEQLVHERINEVRENESLRQLDHDAELREIASAYSERMATEDFYGHTDPKGNDFQDRYTAAGYQCRVSISDNRYATGAENIQYTFAFVDVRDDGSTEYYDSEQEVANAIVENWMGSSGHRENILRPYWENQGIGVYAVKNPNDPGMKVYVTQNFC